MQIRISPAKAEHAPLIGEAILMAIGDEITDHLAGESHSRGDVLRLFSDLARRTDSQYSFLNTLVAVTDNDKVAGLIVSYDGTDLHRLRESFFVEAKKAIGLDLNGKTPQDETSSDEYYLDTIAVFPEYRNKGIATKLIEAATERAKTIGKPAGLLVDKSNKRARKLYDSLGFRKVGERPFAGQIMDHLQR